jgi:hypothetical protein
MNRRSKLVITASAMTAALSPWYASEIASRTPTEAASDVAAEELGPERLGVRLADVEADNLAPRVSCTACATTTHSQYTCAMPRTFSTSHR